MKIKTDDLVKRLEGDTLTPILIYQRLKGKKKFLYESSLKHEDIGRYSFIGAHPIMEIIGEGKQTKVMTDSKVTVVPDKPLAVLRQFLQKNKRLENSIFPFIGGAVGVISYDAIRQYVEIGASLKTYVNTPDVHLMLFEEVVVFDHLEEKIYLVATPLISSQEELEKKLSHLETEIQAGDPIAETEQALLSTFQLAMTKEQFIDKVNTIKAHIQADDVRQVVLSQRLQAKLQGDPFSLYRKLRINNPSPYMYYIDFKEYQVLGTSPESLVNVNNRHVTVNPIAGTRPRGKTVFADQQLEKELLRDKKEMLEHEMLVDLAIADIRPICKEGTIQLKKHMELQKFKHVMHLVSEISGQLKSSFTAIDALIASLPAGTVSGSPKQKAMQIINELEDNNRGFYAGAIGYFSANGNMDVALAIRTMVVKANYAYIQAGAGIVADSHPELEYEETLHKLRAFLMEEEGRNQ